MSNDFEWIELYNLGVLLLKSNDEVYLRTAINRFYYAAFCQARDYLIENKIFYNNKYKKVLTTKEGNVHSATQEIYFLSNKLNDKTSHYGKNISKKLYYLREKRNIVDYNKNVNCDLFTLSEYCKVKSKAVLDSIDKL